jgi:hydroxylaminobenzene mutase
MQWTWAYAAYANWLGCLIGAITGASRLTPIAGAGTTGSPMAEATVQFLLISLSLAAIAGAVLAIWGLRKAPLRQAEGALQ